MSNAFLRRGRPMGTGWRWLLNAAALALLAAPPARADDDAPAVPSYKLTLGRYRMGGGGLPALEGTDLNLRQRLGDRSLWLGLYRDRDFGRQLRAGWDDRFDLPLGGGAQLLPSLQWASGGFVGGSVAVQVGNPYFVQAGIGRTNLKPYVNLNFDPNDALMLSAGWQGEGDRQLSASVIADDRLHTHQQHHHLTARWPVPALGLRLTADLLHKQGLGDGGPVRAWGWTLGLDGQAWFARVARDPKQNFSAQDAWRLSVGHRF